MKLSELKIGDIIKHYQCGELVIAKVIKTGKNIVETEHEPVIYGNDIYTTGYVQKSAPMQFTSCQVTPAAFTENGERITID